MCLAALSRRPLAASFRSTGLPNDSSFCVSEYDATYDNIAKPCVSAVLFAINAYFTSQSQQNATREKKRRFESLTFLRSRGWSRPRGSTKSSTSIAP